MIKLRKHLELRIKKFNEIMKKYPDDIIKWKWPIPIYLLDKWQYIISWTRILKIENDWVNYKRLETFNLSDPIEKQLSRINGFYEVLMWVYTDRLQILYDSVYYDKEERVKEAKELDRLMEEWKWKEFMILLDWTWDGIEQWAYWVFYDYDEEKIYYEYYDMDIKEEEKIEWELTREEFNLLMQIYYGVYDDEKLKKELEEKEKRWEFEEIKKYINDEKMNEIFFTKKLKLQEEEKELLEDYLKLELIRKPTDWAFPELNIKKIYDKNWDEEEQKKVVEKINKELGKEVVVLEE